MTKMTRKPFSKPWDYNEKILTIIDERRLEGHDAHFIRAVNLGVHGDVPTDSHNFRTYPIGEYLWIPEVAAYKAEMDALIKDNA